MIDVFSLKNKFFFFIPIFFLMVWGVKLPFPGRISQRFSYKIHSVEISRYYHDGWITDQSLFSPITKRNIDVGKNFTFFSRTAYLYDYLAILVDYTLVKRKIDVYNGSLAVRDGQSGSKISHELTPSIFAIYRPLRIGFSYHVGLGGHELLKKEEETTLRPTDAFSFHLQFFVDRIPKTALGLGAEYQFSFQPKPINTSINETFFHKFSLLTHIFFTYYVHFRFKYSWEYSAKDFFATRIGNNDFLGNINRKKTKDIYITDSYNANMKHRSRHYLEYLFIYHFVEEFSVSLSLFQLIYSNFESPILGFSASMNFNFGSP